MKKTSTSLFIIIALFFFYDNAAAQNNFFRDKDEATINIAGHRRVIIPEKYRVISLDSSSLENFLKNVPLEKDIINHSTSPVIEIPLPDGTVSHFHVWESSIMEPRLAAKYPNIKTYTGQGIEDKRATIKVDWTDLGFHAMILSPVTSSIFIDPYAQGDKTNYISYFTSDYKKNVPFNELSSFIKPNLLGRPQDDSYEPTELCIGGQLSTYRLAIACDHQYAIAATGLSNPTVAQTLMAVVTTVNRFTGVYNLELDINFVLVNNEDAILFPDAATDPFTANDNGPDLIPQSQATIDQYIGNSNYDVGQTFSTGTGGLTLYPFGVAGIACDSGEKASCVTGIADPVGDLYSVDYVAHELGHEFGAYHSFNSIEGFCGYNGQFSQISNSEPGSGTTIMCYAEGSVPGNIDNALCSSDNLQTYSDIDFNALGFDEITQYISSGNNGNSCAVVTNTGNLPPVVNAGANYTIPVSTPFVLTGSTTDSDIDSLTYSWEEVDINGPPGPWNQPSGNAPIFRSFPPVTVPYRYFPRLLDVINNDTTIGEIMPSYTRVMHFRLTVRVNHSGIGAVCNAENVITVDSVSGPFQVTYPSDSGITWQTGQSYNVTWNPAGTASSPINCSNVVIQLSTDGGLTYPDTLLASTPNTGSAQVTVPDSITTTARIRVMAVGNVFYDISNNNFSIQKIITPANENIYSPITSNWIIYTGTNVVNLGSYMNDPNVQVQLFDASGRKMYSYFPSSQNNPVIYGQVIPIPLSSFARGIYILRLISTNHGTQITKIIVR